MDTMQWAASGWVYPAVVAVLAVTASARCFAALARLGGGWGRATPGEALGTVAPLLGGLFLLSLPVVLTAALGDQVELGVPARAVAVGLTVLAVPGLTAASLSD